MKRESRRSFLLLCVALSAFLCGSACSRIPRKASLEAAPGLEARLARILELCPLPEPWSITADGEAKAFISLAVDAQDPASPTAGELWLAPPLDLADPRFSLGASEAAALGLEPLESILPPRRAALVDGLWPGEEGYAFGRDLRLSVHGASKDDSPPRELSAWAERARAAARAADARPATLCATGDMQAGAADAPVLAARGRRLGEIFRGELLGELRRPDFLVGNLEGAISGRGEPNPRKRFLFRMPPGTAQALQSAGFDLVLFGNNHAFDYGPQAFEDTLRELDESGLPFVGAGRDATDSRELRRIELSRGAGVAFIGFASYPRERMGFTTEEAAAASGRPGINADEDATAAAIATASAGGDAVVVLAHGGDEYVAAPPSYLRDRYRRFADSGAVLVLGSHPHVLQGVEARGSSLIAYSLGNFLFTGLEEPEQSRKSAAISFLMYRGRARGIRLSPVLVDSRGTSPDPDRAGAEHHFAALCALLMGR